MVRTLNEPLPTPIRPSSVASSSTGRIVSTSHPASRIPIRSTSTRKTPTGAKGPSLPVAVNKRPILGEREDNSTLPPQSQVPKRASRRSFIPVNSSSAAPSPVRVPLNSWSIRAPAASSSALPRLPRPSFTRLNAGMDVDVTQLLDYQPSSPMGGTTDDDWFSGAEDVGNITAGRTHMPRKSAAGAGRAVEGAGRMMTPMNSQEIQGSTMTAGASLPGRSNLSRLPTPPSSQPPEPISTPQRPSPSSRRRPRPSPTPPRHLSTEPSTVAAAEPSPNPRTKKTPRLASLGSVSNLRQSSPAVDTPVSTSTARKGKGRASTVKRVTPPVSGQSSAEPSSKSPNPPTASPSQPAPKARRKSTASTKKHASPKPRARKSRSATPPSALARWAGVDSRRRSLTTAALRRITGKDLEIGAGVDSVESSPGEDPLLLKSLCGSDTEVDEDEESDKRRHRSSTLVGGPQTEPRRPKGKSRASIMGFSQSTVKSALSKSTSSGGSSKQIVTSFPFKPYTDAPPPPRIVPEWVPRTVKKKQVQMEYDVEEDLANGSFDLGAGGFGSDADSDFGDGYAGDDTFMNIMTRRDVLAGDLAGKAQSASAEAAGEADAAPQDGHPSSSFTNRSVGYTHSPTFASVSPSSSPSSAGDAEELNAESLSSPNVARSPSPQPSTPYASLQAYLPSPSPSLQRTGAAEDFGQEEGETSVLGLTNMGNGKSTPPGLYEEGEDEEDVGEDVNITVEADTTAEGVSGSWDESINFDVGNLSAGQSEPSFNVDEAEESEASVPTRETDASILSRGDDDVLPTVIEPAVPTPTPSCTSPQPTWRIQSDAELINGTIPNLSQLASPRRSPFRLLQRSTPATSIVETTPFGAILSRSHLHQSPTPNHKASAAPTPRRVQSFDEAARSSLSSSQISDSEGEITADAIQGGWESDESVIINCSGVQMDTREEEEDVDAEGPEEEGNVSRELANDDTVEESAMQDDLRSDQSSMEIPKQILAIHPTQHSPHPLHQKSQTPQSPLAAAATMNEEADADSTQSLSTEQQAPADTTHNDQATSEAPPTSSTDAPAPAPSGGGEKIVLSLISRVIHVKREPDDGDSEDNSEEESQEESEAESDTGLEEDEDEEEEDGDNDESREEQEMNEEVEGGVDEADEYDNEPAEAALVFERDTEIDTGAVGETSSASSPVARPVARPPSLAFVNPTAASESTRRPPLTPNRVPVAISTTPLTSPPKSLQVFKSAGGAGSTTISAGVSATGVAQEAEVVTSSLPQRIAAPTPTASSSSIASHDALAVPAARRRSGASLQPSGLSHQITSDTPDTTPARAALSAPASTEMSASSSASTSEAASESPFVDEGVSVRTAGKSLLAELARAGGKGKQKELRGVVEVSSLDPRAAARAAAILKLNHNYIEHGILSSSSQTPTGINQPSSSTPKKMHHSRRKSYTSHHFDSVASARKLSPEELLNEAELEIVVNETEGAPTPNGRRREGTAFSAVSGVSGLTNFPVPGGWVRTPKRKRRRQTELSDDDNEEAPSMGQTGNSWGIPEWKRLEKVYREEKEAWIKEREVKAMPGGFVSWAKRSTGLGTQREDVTPWDEGKVVQRFVEMEGVSEGKQGAWAEEVILLRIQALERRIASKAASSDKKPSDGSPAKRAKVAVVPISTPYKSSFGHGTTLPPPSTMKRVFGWVWGSSFTPSTGVEAETLTQPRTGAHAEVAAKGKARDEGERPNPNFAVGRSDYQSILPTSAAQLLQLPHARQMKDLSTRPTSGFLPPPPRSSLPRLSGRAATARTTPSIPNTAPLTGTTLPTGASTQPALGLPAKSAPAPILAIAGDLSSSVLGLSTSSSATSGTFPPQTPRIYPQLNQSISQRSAAIKALFPPIHPLGDSTSSTSSATSVGNTTGGGRIDTSFARSMAITGLSRKTSVKDLAKSFEEQGILANALTRVPSGTGEIEALKRVRSREQR